MSCSTFTKRIAALLAVALAACGDPPTNSSAVQVQLTAVPSSIAATPCPPSTCGALSDEAEAITTMVVRETAGGEGVLEGFAVVIRRTSDGTVVLDIATGIGAGTRIGANQSVNVPFAVHFSRALASAAMTLTATATVRDSRDNSPVTSSVTVQVAAIGG